MLVQQIQLPLCVVIDSATAQSNQTLQLGNKLLARLRAICIGAQTLARILIHYRQNARPTAVSRSVTYKVHTPPLNWDGPGPVTGSAWGLIPWHRGAQHGQDLVA